MKGDAKILEALNRALTIELTAINQYFVQAKMLKNWGYLALAKKMWDESMGEMKHADKLIERILFLEGTPNIARYDVIRVGTTVPDQLENDLKLETNGVKTYNDAIELCMKVKDAGTRELLGSIVWRQRLPVLGAANPSSPEDLAKVHHSLLKDLGKDLARLLSDQDLAQRFLDSRPR